MAKLDFLSIDHLKTWLRQHPDGQKIAEELLDEATRGRERVLLVGESDFDGGVIEVYAERSVIFHQIVKPHAVTSKGQLLAEEWVDLKLPLAYKRLYWPVKLRRSILCHHLKQTPEQILERKWNLEFVQALTDLWKKSREKKWRESNEKKAETARRTAARVADK